VDANIANVGGGPGDGIRILMDGWLCDEGPGAGKLGDGGTGDVRLSDARLGDGKIIVAEGVGV
jgi:hypothetical protein